MIESTHSFRINNTIILILTLIDKIRGIYTLFDTFKLWNAASPMKLAWKRKTILKWKKRISFCQRCERITAVYFLSFMSNWYRHNTFFISYLPRSYWFRYEFEIMNITVSESISKDSQCVCHKLSRILIWIFQGQPGGTPQRLNCGLRNTKCRSRVNITISRVFHSFSDSLYRFTKRIKWPNLKGTAKMLTQAYICAKVPLPCGIILN